MPSTTPESEALRKINEARALAQLTDALEAEAAEADLERDPETHPESERLSQRREAVEP